MGEDELGQTEGVAVPAPVRFVVAPELLLTQVVKMVVPVARVIPHRTFDSRSILYGDAPVDLDDVGSTPVLVGDVVAQSHRGAVVQAVLERELRE